MTSRLRRELYCRCGTHLAKDNTERQCARCARASRDKLIAPPEVPAEFWQTDQFRDAFAVQHMGRIARAYRTHPHHYAVYGLSGISQGLLGQWLGLSQAQVSRIENGPPIRNLDTLAYWARVLHIPSELLWFRLPEEKGWLTVTESAVSRIAPSVTNGVLEPLTGPQSNGALPDSDTSGEHTDDPERDLVLVAPWNHRGTVEAAAVLRGGDGRMERRDFLFLTGATLTAPAHQWLVHEPSPVVSGLSGGRISAKLVDRLPAMITELRTMDDVAGGGHVLSLAQHEFGWVAGLLDRASYDEHTGRRLHAALAELGQLAGWVAYDAGRHGLAQRYSVTALRAAHAADDRPLGAHILGEMAYQVAHQGRPTEAVTLIDTALAGTRSQQTPRLLAQLHIQQAHAFATLGDASACKAAISRARSHIEQSLSDDDPPYLYWVRPAEITASAGECLLQLGQYDRAAVMLDDGVAMLDASFERDRQYYLTHLVDALARPGKQRDLEAAAVKGIEVIHLAGHLSSTLNVGRIRDLTRQLKPHTEVPAVREFLERAQGLVAG